MPAARLLRTLLFSAICGAALLCFLPTGATAARDLAGRWGLGLEGGFHKLTGGERDDSIVDQFAGFNLDRGLSRQWTLQLALQYGHVRPGVGSPADGDVGWSSRSGAPLYTPMFRPMVRLQRRFAPAAKVQPFVGVGAGLTSWKVVDKTGQDGGLFPSGDPAGGYDSNGDPAELKGTDLTLGFELGVDFVLSDHWALSLGGRLHVMPDNIRDNVGASSLWGPGHVDANTSAAEGFLGLTRWFGSNDRDDDGIPNRQDLCPDQAEDQDGYEDRDGCPDPDNDGDGIPDDDNEDEDGDDDRDRCPDTPAGATVDADGCVVVVAAPAPAPPAVAPAALPVAGQTIVLEAIVFASGSARLAESSLDRIETLAAALAANPDVVVEVRGHTDAIGESDVNLDLSQRRATAVRDALVQRGIAPQRITAVGYGEDFPVADNASREGRARNRRVELYRVE